MIYIDKAWNSRGLTLGWLHWIVWIWMSWDLHQLRQLHGAGGQAKTVCFATERSNLPPTMVRNEDLVKASTFKLLPGPSVFQILHSGMCTCVAWEEYSALNQHIVGISCSIQEKHLHVSSTQASRQGRRQAGKQASMPQIFHLHARHC